MAICFKADRVEFSKAKIPPSRHEIFAAIGRRTGQRRKIAVVVLYVPPYYNAEQNKSLYKCTNDVILSIKSKYDDPYILYGGDFNRRDFWLSINEYPEIKIIQTEGTRGDAVLDIMASNFNDTITDSGITEPIWSRDGVRTDHNTVFVSFRMPRVPSYTIEKYSYKHLTEEGHNKFAQWFDASDWSSVREARTVDQAVAELHVMFERGIAHSYETKTRKKKSSGPAWMTDWLRDDIQSRRQVFRTDTKRSHRWKLLKKATAAAVKKC